MKNRKAKLTMIFDTSPHGKVLTCGYEAFPGICGSINFEITPKLRIRCSDCGRIVGYAKRSTVAPRGEAAQHEDDEKK